MPIIFLDETSTPMTYSIQNFLVKFRVVDRNNAPVANENVVASMQYQYQKIESTSTMTDTNGEGWVNIQPRISFQSYDILTVRVADQFGSTPIVFYDQDTTSKLFIDQALGFDGKYYIEQHDIMDNGLITQVRLDSSATTQDTVSVIISPFYQSRIPSASGTSFNFNLPKSMLNQHVMTPGDYKIFYCHNKPSGNMYVPNYTLLTVMGETVRNRLLPLMIDSLGGMYIIITDNIIGVPMTIPGNQDDVTIGSSWKAFYSTVDPEHQNSNFIMIDSGTVNSTDPITFTTTPGFFPELNDTPAWFWYSVTRLDGTVFTSTVVQRIIDTI